MQAYNKQHFTNRLCVAHNIYFPNDKNLLKNVFYFETNVFLTTPTIPLCCVLRDAVLLSPALREHVIVPLIKLGNNQ